MPPDDDAGGWGMGCGACGAANPTTNRFCGACGAALVQLYTGLIYRGPALVAECVKALATKR